MLNKFFVILVMGFAMNAAAFDLNTNFKGFVNIDTKELYVDYLAPKAGRPTVILLNGLTYSTVQWDKMVVTLKEKGLGVLRYDMYGMGKTLLKYKLPDSAIPYTEQVLDLHRLLNTLQMPPPYNVVGLSYGGGMAAVFAAKYPTKIQNVVMFAPFTQALQQQDIWIKGQVALTRIQFPYNQYSDDAIYDYFLKQICYTTYPSAEPIVLENPYKLEAVFRMTQGIRKLTVSDEVTTFPKNSAYLVIAEKDQYIPQQVLEDFWLTLPEESRVEKIYVKNSEHKMPEAQPKMSAEIVDRIVSRKK